MTVAPQSADAIAALTADAQPPPIAVEGLRLAFNGRVVMDGFHLRIKPGETVVLAGPSGCGKSTVLACLLALAIPAAGTVRIGGEPLTGESVWRLRRHFAYVPQEPVLGEETPRAWLEAQFALAANRPLRANLEHLPALLDRLALPPELLDQPGAAVSGGEKQRLAIAAALLLQRPVLLLDEPTSALDPAARDRVYELLSELYGPSVLLVSHDEHPALRAPHRLVRIAPPAPPPEDAHGRD